MAINMTREVLAPPATAEQAIELSCRELERLEAADRRLARWAGMMALWSLTYSAEVIAQLNRKKQGQKERRDRQLVAAIRELSKAPRPPFRRRSYP